jgi:membrane protein implicated in regulation of membrane protease activity
LVELLGASSASEVDSLIDKEVEVSEQIRAGSRGQVLLRGSPWQAENIGDVTLEVGSRAKVHQLEGLVLKIK